jgi:SAM-dependent methyltransferase
MRWEVTKKFNEKIYPYRVQIKSIAVVGGSEKDSELKNFFNTGAEITFLGIEPTKGFKFDFFDLNVMNSSVEKYDLILCSQVLEHIWDIKVGLQNLVNLSKPAGLIWINCPFSNHSRGSPEYYSAGYLTDIILKLTQNLGVTSLFSSQIGSWRQYFFTHTIQKWPIEREYRYPLIIPVSRFFFSQLFWRLLAICKSSKITNNERSATETIVLLQKDE